MQDITLGVAIGSSTQISMFVVIFENLAIFKASSSKASAAIQAN